MSSESQDQSAHSDDSVNSEKFEEMMWAEINDPMDAEIEAQIEAELEAEIAAELAGPSARRGGYTRRYINRDHEEDHNRLFAKYFSDSPLYTDEQFRRRFRMRKHLFFCGLLKLLVIGLPIFV